MAWALHVRQILGGRRRRQWEARDVSPEREGKGRAGRGIAKEMHRNAGEEVGLCGSVEGSFVKITFYLFGCRGS